DTVSQLAAGDLMFFRRVKPVERPSIEFGRQTVERKAQAVTRLVDDQQHKVVIHAAYSAEDSLPINRAVSLGLPHRRRLERRSDESRLEQPKFACHAEQIAPEPGATARR